MIHVVNTGQSVYQGLNMTSNTQTTQDQASEAAERPLFGRRAVVTGATGGIGGAIAQALGRDGAHVMVLGRNAERGAQTVAAVERAGRRHRCVRGRRV